MSVMLLAALGASGCRKEPAMGVDWDLSGRHTRAEATWTKKHKDSYTTSIEPIESVRIRLPAGKVLEMPDHASDIILYRRSQGPEPLPGPEGEVLDTVEVYTEPLTVDEAYRRALAYADQFNLPRFPLEAWRRRRERGEEPSADRTATTLVDQELGGKGGPVPNVELLYSSNDERPWVVMVQLYWPPDDAPPTTPPSAPGAGAP